ncbi:MAG: sigma-70 family RNA polymerase sigma factor [Tepidisphaerales bacterium]
MKDLDLLRRYVQRGSQEAFAALVERYIDMVYSAALRQMRDSHQAQDVTQAVFFSLARKARGIRDGTVLCAWLLTATRYIAAHARQSEMRRTQHENKAAEMARAMQEQSSTHDWDRIAPDLDEAIATLADKNREALLLRYFEGRSMIEVAEGLGISEDAAKQRVSRSLDQLRDFFGRRGIPTTTAALGGALGMHAVQAAPVGLAAATVATAVTSATAAGGASGTAIGLAKGAAAAMAWAQTKVLVLAFIAAVMVTGTAGIVVHQVAVQNRSRLTNQSSAAANYSTVPTVAAAARVVGGVVRTPAGQPVGGAEMLLCSERYPLNIHDAAGPDLPRTLSNANGSFAFPRRDEVYTYLVVRCNEGFAALRIDEMAADRQIVVRPWGRIEGTLYVAQRPQPRQKVQLMRSWLPGDTTVRGLNYGKIVQTDDAGHFVFTRVAPGLNFVCRYWEIEGLFGAPGKSIQQSHPVFIPLDPGQSVQADIGGQGRPITGRVSVVGSDVPLKLWGTISKVSSFPFATPDGSSQLTLQQREERRLRWGKTAPGRAISESFVGNFYQCAPDGSFRFEVLPPGRYVFYAHAYVQDPGSDISDRVVALERFFTVPEMPAGREEPPLDLGPMDTSMLNRVRLNRPPPALALRDKAGRSIRLADYAGKYVLLKFQSSPEQQHVFGVDLLRDRLGGDRLVCIQVSPAPANSPASLMSSLASYFSPPSTMPATAPSTVSSHSQGKSSWIEAVAPEWSQWPVGYQTLNYGACVLGPDGKVIGKFQNNERPVYTAIERDFPPRSFGYRDDIAVSVDVNDKQSANREFRFKTVPPISNSDAGQRAVFSIVDGTKAGWVGPIGVLNDGRGPASADSEKASFGFQQWTMEGRFKADLGRAIDIDQINTYAWHRNGNRYAQVYRVYGSDGLAPDFNADPKIGTDPSACGWSPIAFVDTRSAPGGADLRDDTYRQTGVSIHAGSNPLGRYRHLLFACFVTETQDIWGQTFFSEIDVVEHK